MRQAQAGPRPPADLVGGVAGLRPAKRRKCGPGSEAWASQRGPRGGSQVAGGPPSVAARRLSVSDFRLRPRGGRREGSARSGRASVLRAIARRAASASHSSSRHSSGDSPPLDGADLVAGLDGGRENALQARTPEGVARLVERRLDRPSRPLGRGAAASSGSGIRSASSGRRRPRTFWTSTICLQRDRACLGGLADHELMTASQQDAGRQLGVGDRACRGTHAARGRRCRRVTSRRPRSSFS